MDSMFICLSISPIELDRPGIAVATSRAGGVGVLDTEFCSDENIKKATENLNKLLDLVAAQNAVGLRLRAERIPALASLIEKLLHRPHWLILCGWNVQNLTKVISFLPASSSRKLLLEVTDIDQIAALNSSNLKIDGVVAKGHEAGGWVGEDSAFVLTQKLIAKQSLPVYVQGGIGIHTAAACRAVGAAGVVLDDQMWLMPESPLPTEWQRYLSNLNGQEAIAIGERLDRNCRVLSRPGFQVIKTLQQQAEKLELEEDPKAKVPQRWQHQANQLMGWGEPGKIAWPMGQSVGLAASYADRYKTTGRFIQALLNTSLEHIRTVQAQPPLQANAPLAASHKTQYPIVQGPMTRVSDTAEFADAVSAAGGLPLLALALLRGPQVKELLYKTKQMLGDRSWGIGILGFVPQALRQEQLQVVKEVKPPFALIAGGRPDQAAHLEEEGIATYIHVPVPALLKMFLEQGAKRFVFEGRECGGHVGPLCSFLLWESMIETLLAEVPSGQEAEIHVLFAGGIHDALSAAMVSAMAAPLVKRGIRIGVLMGSAYLFTEEAVSCGAIVKGFQEQAIACNRTINLETGPGHASRCAVTPFAQEFYDTRRRMMAAGSSPEEIKDTLEDLTLGRLRIASKGLKRENSEITAVESDKQLTDGMYMIGQVATLRNKVCTVKSLHEDVSEKSTKLLESSASVSEAESKIQNPKSKIQNPSDIAIIGISTLLPKAQDPQTFWDNILNKVDAVTEIPSNRWDWRLYYDSDRNVRDKIYSKWGGFIEDVAFDPMRFGIPPKSLKSIEPLQLLTLEAVRRALEDAGLADGNFDRENTSVILGAGGGIADLGTQYAARCEIPRIVENPSSQVWDRLPEWTEESFPGLLLNVIAGRVANRFDFGGSNFTVDAACASSLAAVYQAVKELETGRSSVVIAGGVDTVQSPFTYMCFSKTQALSPRGKSRTFDKSADGIAISEGIAILVLKRLEDAERDGDRIYAVIKSVASSSDGKGLSMTAPLPAGQMRALKRAYEQAGFSPNTLGLYEAHGTGTAAGDRAELETIVTTLTENGAASKSCAIGSVKTGIGHTKSTAGVAGLVKMALSLHHKVLPPHINVENPLDPISNPESPVYLLKDAKPWLRHQDFPRRAAVSAFGFGGTNFHAVLEEYQGNLAAVAPGSPNWVVELFVWRASDREDLEKQLRHLNDALAAGALPRLRDLAYSYTKLAQERASYPVSLALVAENLDKLKETLESILSYISGDTSIQLPSHVQLNLIFVKDRWSVASNTGKQTIDKVAFLFPGQGAQYPDMGREVALYFKEMRESVELADAQLQNRLPKTLRQYIYPPSAYSDAEDVRDRQALTDTQIAQPALGAIEAGFMDVLAKLGLVPDMVGGHSYGEYSALHCAGVLSREDFLGLSETRGKVMAAACAASDGAMAAVQTTREDLLTRLVGVDRVSLANHNAPRQTVISGEKEAIGKVVDSLNVAGIMARMLPVAGAFHSALVSSAQASLTQAIAQAKIQTPKIPVYGNSTGIPYKSDIDAIRKQLSEHLLSSVEFVAQINAMYNDGARFFVEVGPKSILTKLVSQILEGKNYTAVSVDGEGGGLRGLLNAVATLVTKGVGIKLTSLFEGRDVRQLDLSRLVEKTRKPDLPSTTWLVNGGSSRHISETIGYTGKVPHLDLETTAKIGPKIPNNGQGNRQEESSYVSQSTAKSEPSPLAKPQLPSEPAPTLATPSVTTASPASIKPTSTLATPSTTLRSMSQPMPTDVSQVPVTSVSRTPASVPQPEVALMAYQAYQETMRQFLSLQEKVMHQFLSSTQIAAPAQTVTEKSVSVTHPPLQIQSATKPTLGYQNGHNGNDTNKNHPQVSSLLRSDQPLFYSPVSVPRSEMDSLKVTIGTHQESLEPSSVRESTSSTQPSSPIAPTPGLPHSPTPSLPDRTQIIQILLRLVSDRTGYPVEMLGLDQDLEAELGIDSIKRVEILGALQKNLPESLAASMQAQMESLTRAKSLNSIVEKLLQSLPPTPGLPHSPTPSLPDRTQIVQILLRLVSDRTGYPVEMLGLDQDLEAELGIDSIKRVEILGALQKNLPESLAASMQAQMESLTRVKSLNGLVKHLLEMPSAYVPVHQEVNSLGKSHKEAKLSRVT